MDSLNRTTNRNSGTQVTTCPEDWKSRMRSAHSPPDTSTSTPNAAATESALSSPATSATTTDRDATAIIRTVSPTTNPITHGRRASRWSV